MPATGSGSDSATPASNGALGLVVAVLLSAAPLTALGLLGFIARHAEALRQQGRELGQIAETVARLGDSGLVAVGMGAAILGILGATLLRGSARVAIPIAMILACGWATALVLFLLIPGAVPVPVNRVV